MGRPVRQGSRWCPWAARTQGSRCHARVRSTVALERDNVPYCHTWALTKCGGMGRLRLYPTSVERTAAWRRRHGMAVRPHYPSAAVKQAAYRARKQAAQALAARECAAIQQALRTRAEQSWELAELIDACSRDPDMPHQVPEGCPSGLLAGACAHCDGVAAARVRRHRRALQRLAHVRATREAHGSAPSAAGPDRAKEGAPRHPHKDLIGIM